LQVRLPHQPTAVAAGALALSGDAVQQVPNLTTSCSHNPSAHSAAATLTLLHLNTRAAPELSPLIESFGAPERLLTKDTSCFVSLAKSIIYQQVLLQ
jgi:hypothetical protein